MEGRGCAQFAAIRRDARVEGLSIRELATKYRVHRRTVRQALANAVPPRKTPVRRSPRLDPFKTVIDEMLWADTTPRASSVIPPGGFCTG